ncbi:MAG: 1-acyl-sn-glycerol-3-phosphate acyltransferase [bacterium]|nr:MAG: 1-acyl-sn-glycerol-3-phosphate acyltransferase [bacterium]
MIYRILRSMFQLAMRIFFRRMEVEGLENIPESGPVLFLPNHINALVDALIVMRYVKRPLSLTAKSTLAEYPVIGYLMRSARVIRFYRKQDQLAGADRSRNIKALEECKRRLGEGEALCIFPEGQSHSDPSLRPFRWGAARLALDYTRSAVSTPPLKIVPVGLHFPKKGRFRSDAWVRFGSAIDVQRWAASHPDAGPEMLTSLIENRVRELTINFERREDSILLEWAADILSTGGMPPAPLSRTKESVAARLSLVRLIKDGYDQLRVTQAREIDDLRQRVEGHRSELRRLGISPSEVYIRMDAGRAFLFGLREIGLLLVGLPVAAWGTLNHIIPYQLVRFIALKFAVKRDQIVTGAIAPGIVIFPLFYAAQIFAAWNFLTPFWAVCYAISLPYSGIFTVLYRDRAGGTIRRMRAFARFLRQPELQPRLAAEGRAIIADLQRLGEELEAGQAGGAGGQFDN